MSDCPGYLSIIINDRSAAEQLFHHDVMMPCPARFNLTFTVPRSSITSQRLRQTPQVQTFEVVLDDAKRIYQLLLTYYQSSGAVEDDGNARRGMAAEAYSSKVIEGHTTDVTNVVTACVMVVVICLSVRLLCDVTVLRREKPSVIDDPDDLPQPPCPAESTATMSSRQKRHLVFVSIYLGCNVVYCLLVTFTAVSAVFLFHFRSEIDHVTAGGQVLGNLTRRAISDVDQVSARMLGMELELAERRTHQVFLACLKHVDDMTDAVRQSVFDVSVLHRRRNSTPVSGLMSAVINSTVADVERWVLKYVDELDKQFERQADPVRLHQKRFRHEIVNSGWLLYARSLFNRSTALASLTTSSSSSSSSSAAAAVIAGDDQVMRFLEEMISVHIVTRSRSYSPANLHRFVTSFSS